MKEANHIGHCDKLGQKMKWVFKESGLHFTVSFDAVLKLIHLNFEIKRWLPRSLSLSFRLSVSFWLRFHCNIVAHKKNRSILFSVCILYANWKSIGRKDLKMYVYTGIVLDRCCCCCCSVVMLLLMAARHLTGVSGGGSEVAGAVIEL